MKETRASEVSKLVLILNPDREVHFQASQTLRGAGYSVIEAETIEEALRIAHGGQIDLLMTAVMFPRSSGLEVAATLRARTPELKVIYMSRSDDAIQVGGNLDPQSGFLDEPFSIIELLDKVRAAIGGPRAHTVGQLS